MNWFQKTCNTCSGDCGMYAIALGKKAQEEGKSVTMIVCSDEEASNVVNQAEQIIPGYFPPDLRQGSIMNYFEKSEPHYHEYT